MGNGLSAIARKNGSGEQGVPPLVMIGRLCAAARRRILRSNSGGHPMGFRPIGPTVAMLAACLAAAPCLAQQVCEDIAGTPCPPGEFCRLPDGACCCDFTGICEPIPGGCPAVIDPVCGCDGVTYSNRCEAARAQVSVDYAGPCGAREVWGVRFPTATEMVWEEPPGALAYNVYLDRGGSTAGARGFHGVCLQSALHEPHTTITSEPPRGVLWMLQVTAMYAAGEGPMGSTSLGVTRSPVAPCTCTLAPDAGPCDGVCPRWYYEYEGGACQQFIWGCCGGNANNFPTEDACAATCPP